LILCFGFRSEATAHPVAVGSYDRVVVVRVLPDKIAVDYRLEVNQQTVALDLAKLLSREQLRAIRREEEAFAAFAAAYREILDKNLDVSLDDNPLSLRCTLLEHRLVTEPGVEGQQLQCDYRLEAKWSSGTRLKVRDNNFHERPGRVDLSLLQGAGVRLTEVEQPSAELKIRSPIDWQPGDETRLRSASARIQADETAVAEPEPTPTLRPEKPETEQGPTVGTLLWLTSGGLLIALLIALSLGAIHALTPGHGKTLVAAYLVGERGTIGQAILLGLTTTLAHTWSILLIAVVVQWLWPGTAAEKMQTPLELIGGLIILGLGVWMLLRRLMGQADHVHLFGGHHHHHETPAQTGENLGTLRVMLLGVGGGIVPCGDAIAIYLWTLSREPNWAVPVVFAFSTGLAIVLVTLGLLVVGARRLGETMMGETSTMKTISRILPIISAVLVTVLGFALVAGSMHALRQGSS